MLRNFESKHMWMGCSAPYSEVLHQRTTSTVANQQNANRTIPVTPQPGTDGLQRTSTSKTPNKQHSERPHTTPRQNQQSRQGSHSESRSQPSKQGRNSTKTILLIGDSEITIVENFENCSFKSRYKKRVSVRKPSSQINSQRSKSGPRRDRPVMNRENNNMNNGTACYKCGETNHETSRCKHKEQLKCYYCGFYGHKSGLCLNQ